MNSINMFLKGLKNQLDPSLFDSQSWTFPTEFIRVLNVDGHGMVATFTKGNSNPLHLYGEEFELEEGFKFCGSCMLNEITYIFSYNNDFGLGQIGCYPAPLVSYIPATGYYFDTWGTVKEYKPLLNYHNGTITTNFTTTKFNFDERMVKCTAREDYDGSVNIYFVDFNNADRVINSGFNKEGKSTGRVYTDDNFDNTINLIPTTTRTTTIEVTNITSGGNLKYGNYFIFLRYLTASFDRTSFVAQTGPAQIYDNDLTGFKAQGGLYDKNSDKAIYLSLTDIDTTYPYYELAFIRTYSDINNPVQFDTRLVSNYFPTSDSSPEIRDFDNTQALTLSEVASEQTDEIISKSISQVENIMFKANTKSGKMHDDILTEFCKRVYPLTYVREIDDLFVSPLSNISASGMQHKDWSITYDDSGYFGGEIYALGIKFNFTNGITSDVYPIKGIDNWAGDINSIVDFTGNITTNDKGIYRFPSRAYPSGHGVQDYTLYKNNKIKSLGLNLDFSEAISYINSIYNIDNIDQNFILNNIISITVCRAERKKCLEYQGLSMSLATNKAVNLVDTQRTIECSTWFKYTPNTIGGQYYVNQPPWNINPAEYRPGLLGAGFENYNTMTNGFPYWAGWFGALLVPEQVNEYLSPFYRGYFPACQLDRDNNNSICYTDRMGLVPHYYGIYSPDIIFSGNNPKSNITHVQRIAKTNAGGTTNERWEQGNVSNASARTTPAFEFEWVKNGYLDNAYQSPVVCETKMIGNTMEIYPSNSITLNAKELINASLGDGADANKANHLFHTHLGDNYMFNRSFYALPYLGLYTDETGKLEHNNLAIVNMYNRNPEEMGVYSNNTAEAFKDFYNIDDILYYEISDKIKLSFTNGSLDTILNPIFFKGDCFIQRVFIKQMYWKSTYLILGDPDEDPAVGLDWDENTNRGCFSYPISGDNMRYGHGKVLSFITENAINNAMRFDNVENGNSYFPLNFSDIDWVVKPALPAWMETFLLNHGHSNIISPRSSIAFNTKIPFHTSNHPTRIRHSAEHQIGSFIDGYRIWNIDAFKDYDLSNGQIIEIVEYMTNLISVQERAVNQHYTNQKQQKADITTGQMIVGIGPILAKETKKLINFGSQHQYSVIKTDNGVYGIDYLNRNIWAVKTGSTSTGAVVMGGTSLSETKEIDTWVKEICDNYVPIDVTNSIGDNPYQNIGLVSGYDPTFGEVLFTFLNRQQSIECEIVFEDRNMIREFEWVSGQFYPMCSIIYYNGLLYYAQQDTSSIVIALPDWKQLNINDVVKFQPGVPLSVLDLVYFCDYDEPQLHVVPNDFPNGLTSILDLVALKAITWPIRCICNDTSKTMVYNEKLQQFTSVYPLGPYAYMSTSRDIYSVAPTDYFNTGKIYLHNQEEILTFFGKNKSAILSWIVNGQSEKENSQPLQKIYQSFDIVCSAKRSDGTQMIFNNVSYMTDGQEANNIPFISGEYWRDPEWMNTRWHVPIDVTILGSPEFYAESNMAGQFIKVSLAYKNKVTGHIKEIITNFNISFV